ncbi:MAG: hypothetical protein GF416_02540 [Candidatus Altiarchaeales archaeon]|nr:hypothetical protein [Candidatus Altiarchaeales archaeon]MBD3415997.1 hypothetical protein [Candidatus Altiarchaeales archaeon]
MEADTIFFVERDVCDSSAWSLKWGTLILYKAGLVFYYNRPRAEEPERLQDVVKTGDILEVRVEKMDWLVSKIFWVGRKLVVFKTREGEKKYYLRETEKLFMAFDMLDNSIKCVDKSKK